jgi:hypothetical protein
MASAKFSIGQVSITGSLRIVAREVLYPLAEVYNQIYDPPHPTVRNIVIDGLNPVMHYFDFYETNDPMVQGTLLATFSIDVGLISTTSFEFIEFIVNGPGPNDPAADQPNYVNTDIDGADYMVTQRGIGPRSFEDEIQLLPGGGFTLLNGETFVNQDRWFLTVAKTIQVATNTVSRGLFIDIEEVSADKTINATDYNKLLEMTGAGTIRTITFPLLGSIPEDVIFGFNTHYSTVRYTAIQLQTGEVIRFRGEEKNIIWLGQNETLILEKKAGKLKTLSYEGDYSRLGEKVSSDIAPANSLPETGNWFSFADYPRFYYDYVAKIPMGQLSLVSDVNSNLNHARQRFSIDSAGSKFWIPDTGGYFERNVDPNGDVDAERTQKYTGSYQPALVGNHDHDYDDVHAEGYAGPPVSPTAGSGANNPVTFSKKTKNTGINLGNTYDNRGVNVAVNRWRII